jgi:hypothetical protein
MTTGEHADEQQRKLSREILEAKIHLRVCQLEVLAARVWLLAAHHWLPPRD